MTARKSWVASLTEMEDRGVASSAVMERSRMAYNMESSRPESMRVEYST